ncbi:hypothetical protein QFZ41_000430 [Luteibacter sp. W1I16]|uniref:hypothetical protein n=1 Tax=Luteibacter sp. W1I16 TaxID=3373922 RepID=UPI003D1EE44F
MNPNTPPPHDDDLPDERELAALYARLPKTEPDPALDAAVLAHADRAVPARRRRAHWPVALGSAAVLVLAAGLAWQLRDSRPDVTATRPVPTAQRIESTAPAPASAPVVLQESAPAATQPRMARRSAPAPALKSSAVSKPAPQAFGAVSDRAMKTELGPDDRVGEIRQLLGRGEREEALRRLRELRERYPRYELPQDLRDLTP